MSIGNISIILKGYSLETPLSLDMGKNKNVCVS